MKRVGDFNPIKPPGTLPRTGRGGDDINPHVLKKLKDDLFSVHDPALSLQELSREPQHLQSRYLAAIRSAWNIESPRYDDRTYFDAEVALYLFLRELASSKNLPFSQEAKEEAFYFIDIELQSVRETFEPNLYETEPGEDIVRQLIESKYPIFSLESQIGRVAAERTVTNTLETAISRKDLSPLIAEFIKRGWNPRDYLIASVVYLVERNPLDDRASNLLEGVICYSSPGEKLEEVSQGMWVRPKAYFSYEVLERLMYCVNNASAKSAVSLSDNLQVPPYSKSVQSFINYYSLKLEGKNKKTVEAILTEEKFKELDGDLSGYFNFPSSWIYDQRFNSRKYRDFKGQVEASINRRKPDMPDRYRERIFSLLATDLAIAS